MPKNSSSIRGRNEKKKLKKTKNSKKRPKNSTIKSLSTISVPCMKIQRRGATATLPPDADAHEHVMPNHIVTHR